MANIAAPSADTAASTQKVYEEVRVFHLQVAGASQPTIVAISQPTRAQYEVYIRNNRIELIGAAPRAYDAEEAYDVSNALLSDLSAAEVYMEERIHRVNCLVSRPSKCFKSEQCPN